MSSRKSRVTIDFKGVMENKDLFICCSLLRSTDGCHRKCGAYQCHPVQHRLICGVRNEL